MWNLTIGDFKGAGHLKWRSLDQGAFDPTRPIFHEKIEEPRAHFGCGKRRVSRVSFETGFGNGVGKNEVACAVGIIGNAISAHRFGHEVHHQRGFGGVGVPVSGVGFVDGFYLRRGFAHMFLRDLQRRMARA